MITQSKTKDEESQDEIRLTPIEQLQFPRDSPAFWNDLGQNDKYMRSLGTQLEEQVKALGDDFKTINTFHFDQYHYFLTKHTAAVASVPGFEDLTKTLKPINELRLKLTAAGQKWDNSMRKIITEVKEFETAKDELLQNKHTYLTKLKQYLNTKATKKPDGEKTKKMKHRKEELAHQRVDLQCKFQKLLMEKEVNILNPLVEILSAYAEVFTVGNKLLVPLITKINALQEYAKRRD